MGINVSNKYRHMYNYQHTFLVLKMTINFEIIFLPLTDDLTQY